MGSDTGRNIAVSLREAHHLLAEPFIIFFEAPQPVGMIQSQMNIG